MKLYNVLIINIDDDSDIEVVNTIPVNFNNAVSIDRYVGINLDEDNYYTEIVEVN